MNAQYWSNSKIRDSTAMTSEWAGSCLNMIYESTDNQGQSLSFHFKPRGTIGAFFFGLAHA